MPAYLQPNVYVEDVPVKPRAIERASTSTTAFIGITQRNSFDTDRFDPDKHAAIESYKEYQDKFGPLLSSDDDMGLAVQAFFLNGGERCYVYSLSTASSTASVALAGITITAKGDGPWGNRLFVRISRIDEVNAVFSLEIGTRNNTGVFYAREKFPEVSLQSSARNNIATIINNKSALVSVSVDDDSVLPETTDMEGNALLGGSQSSPVAADFRDFYGQTLRHVTDVSTIVLPGQRWAENSTGNEIVSATLTHCDDEKNCVVIIDPPQETELTTKWSVERIALPSSSYSVLYYPWISVRNPLYSSSANPTVSREVYIPPSAVAAGMWSKIDRQRGVWKSPAGIDAQLTGAMSLRFKVEGRQQDELNRFGINCIRDLPRFGPVIWGARTLANIRNIEMRYVSVRRTTIMIKESISRGMDWAVYEPNDTQLWSSLKNSIENFMFDLFRSGALQGAKAEDAYYVHCGLGETMTKSDIAQARVIVYVGLALLKPAEFTVIKIEKLMSIQ